MGPVIGMAYGMTIMDRNLVKRAFVTEIISLITCLVVGCLLCLVTGPTALAENWPTQEMLARGSWQNFFVACPVAFFSGLGVAVAVMDDQMSSLVGVAISASLLPPAVNAGIMWVAHGFVQSNILVPAASETFAPTAAPIVEVDNATSRFLALSDNTDLPEGEEQYELKKYLEFRGISMAITIANIVLIIVSSILMFRLKEVLVSSLAIVYFMVWIAELTCSYHHFALLLICAAHQKVCILGGFANSEEDIPEASCYGLELSQPICYFGSGRW